jgi:tetratricopeptide (TPR) repeat protein
MNPLEQLTAALREEGTLDVERKQVVRQRLLAPKRRPKVMRWLVPLAAVLAGMTAWASVRGHWWSQGSAPPEGRMEPPSILTAVTVTPEASQAPPMTMVTVTASAPRRAIHGVRTPAPSGAEPTPAPSASNDDARLALQAYREAEHLQFESKDYAGALDAWDRYLAKAGASPLLFDAQYDRGLCLMHLGRKDEARAALTPFATATPGSYRQAEAKTLLETLR